MCLHTCSYLFPALSVLLFDLLLEGWKLSINLNLENEYIFSVSVYVQGLNRYIYMYLQMILQIFLDSNEKMGFLQKGSETYLKGSGRCSWLMVIWSISLLCCAGDKWMAAMCMNVHDTQALFHDFLLLNLWRHDKVKFQQKGFYSWRNLADTTFANLSWIICCLLAYLFHATPPFCQINERGCSRH